LRPTVSATVAITSVPAHHFHMGNLLEASRVA
jgi:hypothetical protein